MIFGWQIGDLILGLLPMLLLIGAWFLFMRRLSAPGSIQARHLDAAQRQAAAFERIATALEKRP